MADSEWPEMVSKCDPWDVVVLGAGPAGAVAARQSALLGHRVLLIEKSKSPRFKVCGGCLGGASLDILDELGLGQLPAMCGAVSLRRLRLANGGTMAELESGRRIAVSRETFDAALIKEAIRAGAFITTETTGSLEPAAGSGFRSIKLRRGRQTADVSAKAVIVATGLSPPQSGFLTTTSPQSRIGLGTVLERSPLEISDLLYMACAATGYVGIAPVERGRLAIAAAVDPDALTAAGSPGTLITAILRNAGLGEFRELQTAVWRGTPLLTRSTRPLSSHRCLLVGDAASYVEPFTGEGIGWAIRSAVLACSLLTKELNEWDEAVSDTWENLHNQKLGGYQRQCRLIVRLLRSHAIRSIAMWSLRRAPNLVRPVIRRLDTLH